MTDYPYTPWVVGGLLAVILAAVGTLAYKAWRSTHVAWKPLDAHGYYPGSKFFGRVPVDPKRLVKALQVAESALIEKTKWSAANMALVGHHVRVYVMDSESWSNLWGAKVAGEQVGYALVVGPSLAALGHELAHLAEKLLDKEVDYAHQTWKADGIVDAIEAYDAWLANQASADRIASGVVPLGQREALSGMSACRYGKPS